MLLHLVNRSMWIFKMFPTQCPNCFGIWVIIKVSPLQLCDIDRLHPKEIDYICKLKMFNETQVWKILVNFWVFKLFYISIKLLELCEFFLIDPICSFFHIFLPSFEFSVLYYISFPLGFLNISFIFLLFVLKVCNMYH